MRQPKQSRGRTASSPGRTRTSANFTPANGRASQSTIWIDSEEWRRFNHFRGGTRAPGGELMIETQARMIRRVQALKQEHEGETVGIVSHGDPLRAAVAFYMGIPIDMLLRFEISPASVSVVELSEWGARVMCVNVTESEPRP